MATLTEAAPVLSQNHMAKMKKGERAVNREKNIHQIPLKVIRHESVQVSDGLDNWDPSLKSLFILSFLVKHPIFNHV